MKKQKIKEKKVSLRPLAKIFLLCCFALAVGWIPQKNQDVSSHQKNSMPETVEINGYSQISFKLLSSYKIDKHWGLKRDGSPVEIPEHIKNLDGKKVAIQGFMLPMDIDQDKVKSLLLFADRNSCCFGLSPSLNGWINVTLDDNFLTKYYKDIPIKVYGTLEVGPQSDEYGGMSLYRMKADKVEVVSTLSAVRRFW